VEFAGLLIAFYGLMFLGMGAAYGPPTSPH
jgi:hypothetical protein